MTAVCLNPAGAAIPVGPAGSGVIDFNTMNALAETEFATAVLPGTGATYTTAAGLQTGMNTLTAASIVTVLPQTGTVPPSTSSLGFRQNTNATAFYIQSRPTTAATNAANVLLATLQNTSGGNIATMTVAYDFAIQTVNTGDELRGFQVMYSLTGASGSWQPISTLSDNLAIGSQSAVVNVGTWANNATLYLLWADDNSGVGGTDESYSIDNFSVTPGGAVTEAVTISNPTNNAAFSQGANITINANATMVGAISGVGFYHDGILIGNDASAPYSVIYSNATLGAHTLTAVATDNTHSITSSIVNITINPNTLPTVTITNPISGSNYFVGVTVTNISASASDTDGTVARVEFYLDGALWSTDTTSPYSFDLCDITAGSHTIAAVAVDNGNGRSLTNSISIVATNPPGITVIVANGSSWKYLDNGTDQGTAWVAPLFNDIGWSNGVGELGYGDAPGRPERTTVGFGPEATNKYATTYFRKSFTVSNPSDYASLNLEVLADDHFIVYLNGVEVFRDMTNAVVTYTTVGGGAVAHDGTVYVSTNLATSVLVAGNNVVAVEIHQDSVNSSDISFDLMLWGNTGGGPSLKITPINASQSDLSWPFPSTGYVLEFKNDLNDSTWLPETSLDVPSGGRHHVTVNTTSSKRFWRLRK